MYEVHEAREDIVVFPAFRAITPEQTLAELGDRFASEQNRQFGRHAFDRILDRVATIGTSLHIYDLAQFTPQREHPTGSPQPAAIPYAATVSRKVASTLEPVTRWWAATLSA